MIIAFHKPFGVISQFTQEVAGQRTLAFYQFPKNVYPVGRLDMDSEGLLVLSDDKSLIDHLLNPKKEHIKTYFVQVEGLISDNAIMQLSRGILIHGRKCRPCQATRISDPGWPARNPPVRFRKVVPTSWIEIRLTEGKNRQVRRMTAAVGFPTLRLIRVAIGDFQLGNLALGQWKELSESEAKQLKQPPVNT